MIKKFCIWIVVSCLVVVQAGTLVDANDWLKRVYQGSHTASQNPYASDVEADDLFNSNVSIQVGNNDDGRVVSAGINDSVIVRFARVLIRITVVLAIPMILYSAIKIALAFGDDTKFYDTLKEIGRVLGGIALVLSSVAIVLLITSLARTSIGLFSAGL